MTDDRATVEGAPPPAGEAPRSESGAGARTAITSYLWQTDAWRQQATRWIDESLERRGITRVPVTPRQPRVRPWSTQLVVDTSAGRAWFKACSPSSSPEPAIYRLLTRIAPDRLPEVWASDERRGWLLMPDQGPQLREVADAETVVGLWSGAVRRYARLQRASTEVTDELLAAGVPHWEPTELVERWVYGRGAQWPGTESPLRAAAERLAASGLPSTIEHNDLHTGNVFCAHGEASAIHDARFFDWGDAYVGNPLCSLMIALLGPSYHFGLPVDPERDARLMRAYTSVWADLIPSSRLTGLLPDAKLIAALARVFAMERALEHATPAERDEWVPRVIDPAVHQILQSTGVAQTAE